MEALKNRYVKTKIEDINEKGIVTIVIARFNKPDSRYGDIIRKGAFEKTFKENERIKHFIDHSLWSMEKVVGIPLKMLETNDAAIIESALNLNKPIAKNLFSDYKFFFENNREMEHSFGSITMKRQENEKIRGEDVTELKMFEYSTVSYAAEKDTPTLNIKSEVEVNNFIQEFELRLSECNYTDEKGKQIEQILTKLKCLVFEPGQTTQNHINTIEPGQTTQTIWELINEKL